jgi:putative hemolysin
MESYWIEILLIIFLVFLNGFFASSEFALISARKSRIKHLAETGHKKAVLVKRIQAEPERFLATIQIGVTLVGTLASVVGGAKIVDLIQPLVHKIPVPFIQKGSETISIGIVVVIISYLFLVIGELVPKHLALKNSEKIAFKVVAPVEFLSRLSYPFVKILSFSTRAFTSLLVGKAPKEPPFISEEEVKYIIKEGKEKGIFDQTEEELIHSVFEFTDTYVHNIMTPRTEIVGLDIKSDTDKVLRTITEEGYSRVPVYKDNLDNIVGIIYSKDVLNLLQYRDLIILDDILHKPYFVPDSKKISELLREFQRKKIHLAMVLDEFGGTAGLITLEDILEEIVGEIEDEYDQVVKEVDFLSDGSAIVSAGIEMDEFNKKLKVKLPLDVSNTLGGFIINSLGRIPALDERIKFDNLNFIIYEKSAHRIKKIKVIKER